MYLPTYLPTYLPAYLPAYLPTYLPEEAEHAVFLEDLDYGWIGVSQLYALDYIKHAQSLCMHLITRNTLNHADNLCTMLLLKSLCSHVLEYTLDCDPCFFVSALSFVSVPCFMFPCFCALFCLPFARLQKSNLRCS